METSKKESKVRQRWHVQVNGERKIRTVLVVEETEFTVLIFDNSPAYRKHERYLTTDVKFIERDAR